MKTVNTHGHK